MFSLNFPHNIIIYLKSSHEYFNSSIHIFLSGDKKMKYTFSEDSGDNIITSCINFDSRL